MGIRLGHPEGPHGRDFSVWEIIDKLALHRLSIIILSSRQPRHRSLSCGPAATGPDAHKMLFGPAELYLPVNKLSYVYKY